MIYLDPSEVRWLLKGRFPFAYPYWKAVDDVFQDVYALLWRGI